MSSEYPETRQEQLQCSGVCGRGGRGSGATGAGYCRLQEGHRHSSGAGPSLAGQWSLNRLRLGIFVCPRFILYVGLHETVVLLNMLCTLF